MERLLVGPRLWQGLFFSFFPNKGSTILQFFLYTFVDSMRFNSHWDYMVIARVLGRHFTYLVPRWPVFLFDFLDLLSFPPLLGTTCTVIFLLGGLFLSERFFVPCGNLVYYQSCHLIWSDLKPPLNMSAFGKDWALNCLSFFVCPNDYFSMGILLLMTWQIDVIHVLSRESKTESGFSTD